MGIVAFVAEVLAHFGVFALFILAHNLVMTLGAVDHSKPLLMGDILYVGMTIGTPQLVVDGGTKFSIIHIQSKIRLLHLLFSGGRGDHIKSFFLAHLEDITTSMTFQAGRIVYRKGLPCSPEKENGGNQR
jgi:hypothetical protein